MVSKSSGPIQRKEEVLEVGLARYQKRKRKLPWWLVEYGGWIAIGCVFLFVLLPFSILGWSFSAKTDRPSGTVPQLYLMSAPAKIWGEGTSNLLRSVSARIANKGLGVAEGVVVKAVINGEEYLLVGPKAIKSGKVEIFSGAVDKSVPKEAQISIAFSCASCQ